MENEPGRELLWNISNHWLMYVIFAAALAVATVFFVRRWRLWRIGGAEDRSDRKGERIKGALRDSLMQIKVLEKPGVGFMHGFMYLAMIIMLVATALTAMAADMGVDVIRGDFYLYFMALTVDLAGLAFCLAMIGCLVRRAVDKSLDTKPADIIVLALLLVIGITGFVVEGLRIAGAGDPWSSWSPIGSFVSGAFTAMDPADIRALHQGLWWFHMGLAFGLIAYWTYSKLVHVLLIPKAAYHRDLDPKGTLPFIDCEDENLLSMGTGKLEEFTWKDLFDTQSCIRCNRCQEVCPAYQTGKALSPRELIQNLGGELEQRGPIVYRLQREAAKAAKGSESAASDAAAKIAADGKTGADGRGPGVASEGSGARTGGGGAPAMAEFDLNTDASLTDDEKNVLDRRLVGDVVAPEALWACTTCGACMEVCPSMVEHTPKTVKMRTYQVSMESDFPAEATATFRNLETNGNPWGLGWQTRSKWAKGLDVPTLAEASCAEYLYWPGCSGAFDRRSRKVSEALVALLKEAGVDFAILGNEEKCCGDAARRMGNEFAYHMLARENIATLDAYGVKKIIVQCPHCLQALSRDYPQLGGHYEVIHHSVLLHRLIEEGRLKPHKADVGAVAFHDSCYLGRYHDVYHAPRAVIEAAGGEVREMELTGKKSFCCGAGGGRMWMEENDGERINAARARQALDVKPDVVATSCPFCLTMLSDGVVKYNEEVSVKDIAELLVGGEA